MLKMTSQSTPIVAQTVCLRRRLHKLMERTLLLAALSIAIGLALPLYADTRQLLFDENAIKDPGSLVVKLQDTRATVSEFIASQLSEDMQWILLGYDGASEPTPQQQKVLLSDLNRLLEAGPLYDVQLIRRILNSAKKRRSSSLRKTRTKWGSIGASKPICSYQMSILMN